MVLTELRAAREEKRDKGARSQGAPHPLTHHHRSGFPEVDPEMEFGGALCLLGTNTYERKREEAGPGPGTS